MKAIIMAGGEGTRLRPLTCDCPKPMMRLLDRPVMAYALELLRCHGVTEAAVTLGYLPKRISDFFGDGSDYGLSLRYYTEQRPLGTAGGVKQARDFLTETFCVLSGDGVTDCDLSAALAFHRKKHARATMVLKHVPNPTSYGLVITSPEGRVVRFVEKPAWGEAISDAVNTGIYLLEPEVLDDIPDGPFDFGRDLFPAMAASGGLYGYVTEGYWCDVGDVAAYLRVNRDALDGRIALPSLREAASRVTVAADARVSETAELTAPCYIGKYAVVGDHAHVGAHSVIGARARLEADSGVKRGILWPESALLAGAQARGCVLGRGAVLGERARAFENCVLGTRAVTGTDSELAPGASVWPGRCLPETTLQRDNLVWGEDNATSCFRGGAFPLREIADALRFSQALAARLHPKEILLGRTASGTAAATWHLCAAGLMAQGVSVLDAGVCTLPQLRFYQNFTRAGAALLADEGSAIPLNGDGCLLPTDIQRSVCALISRQDYPAAFSAPARPAARSGCGLHAYAAMLASAFRGNSALCPRAAVYCENPQVLDLAERVFAKADLRARVEWETEMMDLAPGEIGIWLSRDGSSASFSHEGGMLTAPQNELLRVWCALETGERELIVPSHATRAVEILAERDSATVRRAAAPEQTLAEHPTQLRLLTDGLFFALSALSALTEHSLTLQTWLATVPRIHRVERSVPLDDRLRGQALRRFGEQNRSAAPDDGLSLQTDAGFAWLVPDERLPECRVVAEAFDTEAAAELCDFCEQALRKALKG